MVDFPRGAEAAIRYELHGEGMGPNITPDEIQGPEAGSSPEVVVPGGDGLVLVDGIPIQTDAASVNASGTNAVYGDAIEPDADEVMTGDYDEVMTGDYDDGFRIEILD